MEHQVPSTKEAFQDALHLSKGILKNIELNEIPLNGIALKTARLARLLDDFDMQHIMECEVSGYPSGPDGVRPDIWQLAVKAGRKSDYKDKESGEYKSKANLRSIGELEEALRSVQVSLEKSTAPIERNQLRPQATRCAKDLESRRGFIYSYVARKHYELRFSGIADDLFTSIRKRVDDQIGKAVPEAVKRFSAVYSNLRSENPEDWSNAVHSCRRILQDLADSVYPPRSDKKVGEDGKSIKLGKENYINRIITFAEESSSSARFREIVGSHLSYLGDRLDSIFKAAQKGSHATIISREEAERYVVYTYLILGDILSLAIPGTATSVEE